jgi:hypothetical protein
MTRPNPRPRPKVALELDPKAKPQHGFERIVPLRAKRALPYVRTRGRGGQPGRVHLVRYVTVWGRWCAVKVWCGTAFNLPSASWRRGGYRNQSRLDDRPADGIEVTGCAACVEASRRSRRARDQAARDLAL